MAPKRCLIKYKSYPGLTFQQCRMIKIILLFTAWPADFVEIDP